MLEQLRSNKAKTALAALIVCVGYSLPGFCYDLIEKMHTTETVHGLYEIKEEAQKFITEQNAKNHTDWFAGSPNLKTQVTRCAVPLKTKWAPASYELSGKNVLVYCTKTIKGYSNKTQWTIIVPVGSNSPKDQNRP